MPSAIESGLSGLNDPVKGAVPPLIGPAASSLKTVFVRLSPEPPRRLESAMFCPIGEISVRTRSPS